MTSEKGLLIQKKYRIVSAVLAIVMTSFSSIHSAQATDFTSPPSNLTNFESTLNQSLVGVQCGGVLGVGMAGNYTIPAELKNNGFNSLILTSGTTLYKCRFVNGVAQITYQGMKYDAPLQFWNGQTSDFAVAKTSLALPVLPLYGRELPQSGWWVDVVQNVPGFGLVWKPSVIRLVNSNTLTLAIDSVNPSVTDNALVFNNQGTFLGVVSSFGVSEPNGEVIVQGAPLQCQLSKANSSATATICGMLASEVWNSNPAPTPTVSAAPATQEVVDALSEYSRVSDSYKALVQDCENAISSNDNSFSDYLSKSPLIKKCHDGDAKVEANDLVANETSSKSKNQTSSGLSALVSQVNSLVDQLNTITDSLTAWTSILRDAQDQFSQFESSYQDVKTLLETDTAKYRALTTQVNRLPVMVKNSIFALSYYKELGVSYSRLLDTRSKLLSMVQEIGTLSTIDNLNLLQDKIDFLAQNSFTDQFDLTYKSLLKNLPNAFCNLKNVALSMAKNGTCPKGLALTKIHWHY